jgi:hypothetical protein
MKFSIRHLFGITLLTAILINPIRNICQTPFIISLYKSFINVSLWVSSWFLNFEPTYYSLEKTIKMNRYPYYYVDETVSGYGVLAGGVMASLFWFAIFFWTSMAIAEIFGYHTPLRPVVDKYSYKYKIWRKGS